MGLVRAPIPFPLRRDERNLVPRLRAGVTLRNPQPRVPVRAAGSATNAVARLLRPHPGPVRGSTRNRLPTSAPRAREVVLPVSGRQRNLRNSRTRDWSASGSITETSLAMPESSATNGAIANRRLFLYRRGRFEAENGFAFLHQVESVARDRFQINRIGFQQVHFASLARQKRFLLVHLALQVVNFALALRALFVERQKQTHDHQHNRGREKDA